MNTIEYRVDELARAAGISVELLRSYQSKGLLPPPRHQGRVALYRDEHLARLQEIRDLKQRGYSLKMLAATLAEHRRDRAAGRHGADGADGWADAQLAGDQELDLRQVGERTSVPPAVLRSLEASGVLRPRRRGEERHYTEGDVQAVRMVLTLIGDGLPMEDFLRVARLQIAANDAVAEGAADLFLRFVRAPLRDASGAGVDDPRQLAQALRLMVHATTTLMTYNFQRAVLNRVQQELEGTMDAEQVDALRDEIARRIVELLPS